MTLTRLTGPMPVPPGKKSPFFPFSPDGERLMFLRAVALWTDNTPLPGAEPVFQLRAPGGIFTDVKPDGKPVDITGDMTGKATCVAEGKGIFLVSVSITSLFAPASPWHIRIENTADRELRFVTVSSTNEPATRQPWIVIGDPPRGIAPTSAAEMTFNQPSDGEFLKVSNWGTGELTLLHDVGETLGDAVDSPLVLAHRPKVVAPHGVDHMIIRCTEVGFDGEIAFRFASTDERPDHGLIKIHVHVRLS